MKNWTDEAVLLRAFLRTSLELFLILQGLAFVLEVPIGASAMLPGLLKFMPLTDILSDWTICAWIVLLAHAVIAPFVALAVVGASYFRRGTVQANLEVASFVLLFAFTVLVLGALKQAVASVDQGLLGSIYQILFGRWAVLLISALLAMVAYRFAPRAAVAMRLRGAGIVLTAVLVPMLLLPIVRGVHIVDIEDVHPDVAPSQSAAAANAPNILLVIVDTLSAPAMSLYGNPTQTTPSLDRMAANATVFNRYTAVGNFTTPTVATIYSGMEPAWHRVISDGSYFRPRTGLEKKYLLPQQMHAAGYETIAIPANIYAHPLKYRIEDGFDEIYTPQPTCGPSANAGLLFSRSDLFYSLDLFQSLRIAISLLESAECGYQTITRFPPRTAYEIALDRLAHRADAGRPFFAVVHVLPPHAPYLPPPPFIHMLDKTNRFTSERDYRDNANILSADIGGSDNAALIDSLQRRYGESIRYTDSELGNFLARAQDGPWLRNTVVIVTADHGEAFHGWVGHSGPLLSQELIWIPLVMAGPGIPRNKRIGARVSEVDLAPTILDLAHIRIPAQMTGHSLLHLLDTNATGDETVFSSQLPRNSNLERLTSGSLSEIEGRWKYVQNLDTHREQLFDLIGDPLEQTNLAGKQPTILKRLRGVLERHFAGQKFAYPAN